MKVVCTRPQCIFSSSPLATRDRAGFGLQERGLFRTELDDEVAKIATLTGLVVSEIGFFVSSTGNFNHFAPHEQVKEHCVRWKHRTLRQRDQLCGSERLEDMKVVNFIHLPRVIVLAARIGERAR